MPALTEALLSMAGDQGVEAISVAELCRVAGVHRTTFYGHFESVDAFAVEALTGLVDEMATVDVAEEDSIEAIMSSYFAALTEMLGLLRDRRAVYRGLFEGPVAPAFREALRTTMEDRIGLALVAFHARRIPVPVDDALAVKFLAGGMAAALEQWVRGEGTDLEAGSQEIFDLFPGWWPG
ncbi:MAG: TetR/AcrR family transcriptional regulator [Myxococcota bacterium]|nr:TetR/AcrR family transcriptional regulator [Myxococcota bacterium]